MSQINETFSRLANKCATAAGSFWAFSLALLTILVWAALGPAFHFSGDWQLVINTATTIVTFLMVFLIQHAQNKDTRALHLKLNELIAAHKGASNRLIDVEDEGPRELEQLYSEFRRLARDAAKMEPGSELSVDDAGRSPGIAAPKQIRLEQAHKNILDKAGAARKRAPAPKPSLKLKDG